MRILYQHRTLADGAEGIHIHEMVESFEQLGHQVSMHALASSSARGVGKRGLLGRIKGLLPGALFELAAAGYNVVDYVRLSRAIRREAPDFVYKRHAHYDIGVVLAAKRAGVPLVLEANAAYSSLQNRQYERVTFPFLSRWLESIAVRNATVVVAVSTPMAEHLRRLTGRPDDVLVIPNGANPERFRRHPGQGDAVRRQFGLTDAVVVGWSGILRDWHRVDLLFEAIAPLTAAHVLIVGDGPDRARLHARAVALGVENRVHVTGRVPHDEVPAYVSAFDIAVAVHDGTGYASPMKLLEYMAIGLPVVAPQMRNIEDIVESGVDGVLFTPGSAQSLADAVRQLLEDPQRRLELGSRARLKIERERNWTRIAAVILGALAQRKHPPAAGPRNEVPA